MRGYPIQPKMSIVPRLRNPGIKADILISIVSLSCCQQSRRYVWSHPVLRQANRCTGTESYSRRHVHKDTFTTVTLPGWRAAPNPHPHKCMLRYRTGTHPVTQSPTTADTRTHPRRYVCDSAGAPRLGSRVSLRSECKAELSA